MQMHIFIPEALDLINFESAIAVSNAFVKTNVFSNYKSLNINPQECYLKTYATVYDFFLNNRFLSNFMYVKNMLLWNEKPNKNETLPGSIFLRHTKDVTYLIIFYDFHSFLCRHEIIGCIIRISQ